MAQIHEAIAALMGDVEAIKKDKQNKQQGFSFRGIDDVYNTLHGKLAARGVFSVPTVESEHTEERKTKSGANLIYRVLRIRYTFYAADGSSIDCTVIGEGMDSGDKAANKAMAVAHKYALLQTLCVPTDDMPDPDAESHDVAPREGSSASVQALTARVMSERAGKAIKTIGELDDPTVADGYTLGFRKAYQDKNRDECHRIMTEVERKADALRTAAYKDKTPTHEDTERPEEPAATSESTGETQEEIIF